MTMWLAVIVAALACTALKQIGYLVPARWLEGVRTTRTTDLLTVALLGALVAVQTVGSGMAVVLDARLAGLAAAAVLLSMRAPFLVVVLAAAVVAATLRALGLAA
ncbi:AzlD domain-containing protein [Microbacterium karelineae]|uniref:AzlD domain-containing protein n=1 Tax=Microbacterium karelineae TaxID=2654283 RepID=UPI0012EA47ED|nr:AzlD domain-containing protein [Microbacterium karelineae]